MLSSDWSLSNSLIIAAVVRSEMTVFDTSKMVPITKKKLSQDIVKCIRISPFNEALIASCSSFNVEVINLRMGNQAIPIVQKEPVSAISWHPKNPILVSCFSKIDYVYSFIFSNYLFDFFPYMHRLSGTMKKLEFFTFQINSLKNWNTYY